MFASKKLVAIVAIALVLNLTTLPFMTAAHQSNMCPVHEHTTMTFGTCSSVFSLDSWYDPMTGCFHHLRCILGIRTETRTCPDGVTDTCHGCGVETDECDEHWVDHIWGCNGNSKPHGWYTCRYNNCPYEEPSS